MTKISRREFLLLTALGASGLVIWKGPKIVSYFNPQNPSTEKIQEFYIEREQIHKGEEIVNPTHAPTSESVVKEPVIEDIRQDKQPLEQLIDLAWQIRGKRDAENPNLGNYIWEPATINRINILVTAVGEPTYLPPDFYRVISIGFDNQIKFYDIAMPRDTISVLTGKGNKRINQIWDPDNFYKNPNFLVPGPIIEELEYAFGLPIDFYAHIHGFNPLIQLINALGGIEVVAPNNHTYKGITYISGDSYPMMGELALKYSKRRQGDSDRERIQRQSAVIDATIKKLMNFAKPNLENIREHGLNYLLFPANVENLVKKYMQSGEIQIGTSSYETQVMQETIYELLKGSVIESFFRTLTLPDRTGSLSMFKFIKKNPHSGNLRYQLGYTNNVPYDAVNMHPSQLIDFWYNATGARDYIKNELTKEMSIIDKFDQFVEALEQYANI